MSHPTGLGAYAPPDTTEAVPHLAFLLAGRRRSADAAPVVEAIAEVMRTHGHYAVGTEAPCLVYAAEAGVFDDTAEAIAGAAMRAGLPLELQRVPAGGSPRERPDAVAVAGDAILHALTTIATEPFVPVTHCVVVPVDAAVATPSALAWVVQQCLAGAAEAPQWALACAPERLPAEASGGSGAHDADVQYLRERIEDLRRIAREAYRWTDLEPWAEMLGMVRTEAVRSIVARPVGAALDPTWPPMLALAALCRHRGLQGRTRTLGTIPPRAATAAGRGATVARLDQIIDCLAFGCETPPSALSGRYRRS